MASSHNDLKLPYDDYLPSIFFAIPKKKYTAFLVNKAGSFSNEISENKGILVNKITDDQNILSIKNDINNNITSSNKL